MLNVPSEIRRVPGAVTAATAEAPVTWLAVAPSGMHTQSFAPGTASVLQLAAVSQRPSPAEPSHSTLQLVGEPPNERSTSPSAAS